MHKVCTVRLRMYIQKGGRAKKKRRRARANLINKKKLKQIQKGGFLGTLFKGIVGPILGGLLGDPKPPPQPQYRPLPPPPQYYSRSPQRRRQYKANRGYDNVFSGDNFENPKGDHPEDTVDKFY